MNPDGNPIFKFRDNIKTPHYKWTDSDERDSATSAFLSSYEQLSTSSSSGTGWVRVQDIITKANLTYIQYRTLRNEFKLTDIRDDNFARGSRMINFRPIEY